jgi:hypothetical protein
VADLEAFCGTAWWEGPGVPAPDSPDGRLWFVAPAKGAVVAVEPPAPAAGVERVFHPCVALKVEAACGSQDRNDQVAGILTACLRDMGQVLGENGWTLRVTAEQYETPTEITFPLVGSLRMPGVRGKLTLLAPDGTAAVGNDFNILFPRQASKYFKKADHKGVAGGIQFTEIYDFGTRPPRQAMADETWEIVIRGCRFYGEGVVRSDGKYLRLPLREAINVP